MRDSTQPAEEGPATPKGVAQLVDAAQRGLCHGLGSRQVRQRRQAFLQQRRLGAAIARLAARISAAGRASGRS